MVTDVYGLSRSVAKQIDLTIDQYNGLARDGELIVDMNPGPGQYRVYVGTASGAIANADTGVASIGITSNNFAITGSPVTDIGTINIDIPTLVTTTNDIGRVVLFSDTVIQPTGYEFLLKSVNVITKQINLERMTVVSSEGNCNFSRFGQVDLGISLGTPDATMVGPILEIAVTPDTYDLVQWTLQYQKI